MRVLATPTLDQSTSGSTCSMLVHYDCGAGRSPHMGWTKKWGRDIRNYSTRIVIEYGIQPIINHEQR